MQTEDTQPWYRQFWPWFIIALPASAVIGGLVTVWIALQTNDSLIYASDDGINVVTERIQAAAQNAAASQLSAEITIDSNSGAVVVMLTSANDPGTPAVLALELSHPTDAALDREVELVRGMPAADGRPTWVGHFVNKPTGRYYAVLSAGDQWRLSGEWSGSPTLHLGARSDGHR